MWQKARVHLYEGADNHILTSDSESQFLTDTEI